MFKEVKTAQEYQDVLLIRETVFIEEQGVSREEELDEYEHTAHYIIGYDEEGQPIATARYRGIDDTAKIERVAVMKAYRGKGMGKKVIVAIEQMAIKHGYRHFKLGAQTHAIPFYESLGYQAYGQVFMDAGIPHRHMEKYITDTEQL
ncbi:GNAT family N-acetyltransferase [Staphylococcus americanisciuri]|uniref:GCN5-related N-acetyltransferase n=1 Tax=Staphylococcus americanisciuri TaxID=2973940 RepID=A0ABT2F3Q9_9STAP|nr:GNAT family N-acetyltransferase [Staphylococcus americanisciuri]MCS4486671.1 GNAT family N-acetyltransferase [Staphylococcus americanisciuri]